MKQKLTELKGEIVLWQFGYFDSPLSVVGRRTGQKIDHFCKNLIFHSEWNNIEERKSNKRHDFPIFVTGLLCILSISHLVTQFPLYNWESNTCPVHPPELSRGSHLQRNVHVLQLAYNITEILKVVWLEKAHWAEYTLTLEFYPKEFCVWFIFNSSLLQH